MGPCSGRLIQLTLSVAIGVAGLAVARIMLNRLQPRGEVLPMAAPKPNALPVYGALPAMSLVDQEGKPLSHSTG